MTAYEHAFCDTEKEKLPFKREKPQTEAGSGRGSHPSRPVGLMEREKKKRAWADRTKTENGRDDFKL